MKIIYLRNLLLLHIFDETLFFLSYILKEDYFSFVRKLKNTADMDLLKMVLVKILLHLKIIFVHYNWDFKNFFQKLCFGITKYALYRVFLFEAHSILQKPRAFNHAQKLIGTPNSTVMIGVISILGLTPKCH